MKSYALSAIVFLVVLSGCHTSASFVLPPNTDLMINGEHITFDSRDSDGRQKFERTPFFWTSIAGIEYSLIQNDEIVKTGKLPSEFRIVSIFWPPYAFIYWPVGFLFDCYDLSNMNRQFAEKCAARDDITKSNTVQPTKAVQ
jgi:hypothetical protein